MQGVVIVLFIVLAVVFALARFGKAHSILDDWARENGFRLVESRRTDLFRGPFLFTTGKLQVVYHIVVEDLNGERRSGYARLGGYVAGLFSDRVDVRWDD